MWENEMQDAICPKATSTISGVEFLLKEEGRGDAIVLEIWNISKLSWVSFR